jgi:hypothetical protein
MELMPSPLIDTPEALDAATATAVQARREKLLRIAEGKGTRTRVAYVFIALVAICAVAAFLAGDRRAATIIGIQACWVFGFAFISNKAARRKALRELQEMKLTT